ncbi:glutamine--fructose-6-phosphate transaminase (isomerizing) [Ketobacter sp. MCCC 1A13808]|uniref:glutamine--fructose-6-phosphate transaminase (isomerizing) n=1 Tax=Ketobacter sp. MCCC 1A13808 TaxID=2602738 RepID=UPI0012EC8FD6|nr:glutamine--fructose-6-phosphate transaminase (isomerizing) [Ketobacter sp. MCCC 1A13808]MVF13958.1 glutamine--fructose-6-phosphate transaminase (isomerizing) [Ketobacter sp. MCCC 1A13808]
MCGIVGAVSTRDVTPILIEGLKRLEYRGYDSAGIARFSSGADIEQVRRVGKVNELVDAVGALPGSGTIGIAHTRWATHGMPSEINAHPHMSSGKIAVVHNGIIENHEHLRAKLQKQGYQFLSQTDTEVVAHLVHYHLKSGGGLLAAVNTATQELEGAYALGVVSKDDPDCIVAARQGSPLVIGVGLGENFIASDQLALLPVTTRFIFLEEGDIAEVHRESIGILNSDGQRVEHPIKTFTGSDGTTDKGEYRHFMLKEIFEQPNAIRATLEGRSNLSGIDPSIFGADAQAIFERVKVVQIIACGTSYHAGLVAKYWLEGLAGIPCNIEVASEFRYRKTVVQPGTLFVTISQSGETADTLAALRAAQGYLSSLAICNVSSSSLVRESAMSFLTKAGPEIGVASTKAFTTQLVGLYLMTLAIGKFHGIDATEEKRLLQGLQQLPDVIQSTLKLNQPIEAMAERFAEKNHALFLGRGLQYPIALEGALKLKEISYIHAEAYPAGELKHGPLALVDNQMPVVTVAPSDALLEKLKSNLQEVRARGGELFVFQDTDAALIKQDDVHVLDVPKVAAELAPIVYTIPLQLLSYHVAIIKGTDVDQPRNLAKSVTVE